MKTLITALLISMSAIPAFAEQFQTAPEYQHDFENAKKCRSFPNGRLVWKGERAFYIQSNVFYTDESGLLSEDSAGAISISGNSPSTLDQFYRLCR